MNNDPLDIIALLVALLTFVTSREVAAILGPYAAIMVAACGGAAVSLSGNDREMTLWRATFYICVRVLLAFILTVAIAKGIKKGFEWEPGVTMVPIAFAIGWIRDYDGVRTWMGGIVDKFFSRKADGR